MRRKCDMSRVPRAQVAAEELKSFIDRQEVTIKCNPYLCILVTCSSLALGTLLALGIVGVFVVVAQVADPPISVPPRGQPPNWTSALPCIDLQPSLSLDDCTNLSVPTETYNPSRLCSETLAGWTILNFTQAEQVLYDGLDRAAFHRKLVREAWSNARAVGLERATERYVSTHGSAPACPLSSCDFESAVSYETAAVLSNLTFFENQMLAGYQLRITASLQSTLDRTIEIDADLSAIRTNLTSLATQLSTLGSLGGLYASLVESLSGVTQCDADLAALYDRLLHDRSNLNLRNAEAVLARCASLLTSSLVEQFGEVVGTSSGGSCARRQLAHNPTATVIGDVTLDECFAEHALVQPSYDCGPSCCPAGAAYGDPTCDGNLHSLVLSQLPGDHVVTECRAFQIYAQAVLLVSEARRIVTRADLLDAAIAVIETNAGCTPWPAPPAPFAAPRIRQVLRSNCACQPRCSPNLSVARAGTRWDAHARADTRVRVHDVRVHNPSSDARDAVETCATDATGLVSAYTTNAQSIVKVDTCQRLIAEEFRRIAEECLTANRYVIIPFYGLQYLSSGCLDFWRKILGIVSTFLTVALFCAAFSCFRCCYKCYRDCLQCGRGGKEKTRV